MTVDLMDLFADIKRDAQNALDKLAAGEAKNGTSALQKIRAKAEDGERWALAEREDHDPLEIIS